MVPTGGTHSPAHRSNEISSQPGRATPRSLTSASLRASCHPRDGAQTHRILNRAVNLRKIVHTARNWAAPCILPDAAPLLFEETLNMRCQLSLVCTSACAGFREGDCVTDPAEIKKLRKRTSNFARVYSLGREPAPAAATVVQS
jgi:hypothetical protein